MFRNKRNRMKVFLKRRRGQAYYAGMGNWSRSLDDALMFQGPAHAFELAITDGLKGVEVLLKFPTDEFAVSLPLMRSSERRTRFSKFE